MSTHMGTDLRIRPYEPRDRAAVRQICCDTADAGQPVERFFPDREVIADLLTNYYTQFEPQSAFVADNGSGAVGDLAVFFWLMRQPSTCLAYDIGEAVTLYLPG